MTDEQTTALVLKDGTGNYFLVPQEALEQGRVPEERKAQIEQLMREQDDTQGHLWWLEGVLVPAAVIATGAYLIGRELNRPVSEAPAVPFPREEPQTGMPHSSYPVH
jgi:hypothetical protein